MTASERQKAIIEILSVRRYEKMENIAFEFHVSRRTIINDIFELSLIYPIFTSRGTGGGVFVMEGAKLSVENRFSTEQSELLQRLAVTLKGKDAEVMKRILLKFGKPRTEDCK